MTRCSTIKTHLSRICRWWLSFQTWRCQWTDTITACHCTPNHCTLVSTTTPGAWAMKRDPWAGMRYHGSLSNRIFPHVGCSRNHGKPHMLGCSCCLTPWVLTMNKVDVQISSFADDWLKGFFRSSYWASTLQQNTPLEMQWQHFVVTPM